MDPNVVSEEKNNKEISSYIESKYYTNGQANFKRHVRSSSLETNNVEVVPATKTALIPLNALSGFSGTLKSKHEEKRISKYLNKAQNVESYNQKQNFDSIRNIFENRVLHHSNHYDDQKENITSMSESKRDSDQTIPTRDTDTVFSEDNKKKHNSDIPPRITAMLSKRKNVIRPIAFKPVPYNNNNNNNKNSPTNSIVSDRLSNNCTEKYGSTPSLMVPPVGNCHRFGSTTELNYHHGYNYSSLPRKYNTSIPFKTYDSLESILNLPDSITPTQYMSKSSHLPYHEYLNNNKNTIAPSPSESNVSDLETILRERETELAHLRRTMEHNEKVIFKVHQDKERHWEIELNRLKAIHENRLKAGAQKVHKLEQLLMMQTFTLRQDKKRLIEEVEYMKQQNEKQRKEINLMKMTEKNLKDQNYDLSEEIQMLRRVVSDLKEKLEEMEWNLCQKNEETSLMKNELSEAQNEATSKNKQIFVLKFIISMLNEKLSNKFKSFPETNHDISQTHQINDQLIESLNNEVHNLLKDPSGISSLNDYDGIAAGQYLRYKYSSPNSQGTASSLFTTSSASSEKRSEMELNFSEPTNDHVNTPSESTSNRINNEMKRMFLNTQLNLNEMSLENIKSLPDLMINLSSNIDESIYVNSSEDDFKSLSSSREILSPDNASSSEQHLLLNELEKEEQKTLLQELQKCKENEMKWEQEKQKILIYQRQLQNKYLQVLEKTEELEKRLKSEENKLK